MLIIVVLFITLANLKQVIQFCFLYFLNFQSIQEPFLFSINKMVDIMDIYISLNISIGTVMKNPEMLKFVPDNLKTFS